MADELAAVWREQIESKGLSFSYVLKTELPGAFDEVFLRTVMVNLLRNALHYTLNGSITLELGATGFAVSDTGQGIPAEARSEVFQSFVRHSTLEEGSGVGLSLVRRICALQGWKVDLTAVHPQGCRFDVSLQPA